MSTELRIPQNLQCNELNRGHPTFFVAPFSKYLIAFSLMEMNFSPQVPHLRLVRYERTLILLFWTRLVIGKKTLGGPGWVRYTVSYNLGVYPIYTRNKVFLNVFMFLLGGLLNSICDNLYVCCGDLGHIPSSTFSLVYYLCSFDSLLSF